MRLLDRCFCAKELSDSAKQTLSDRQLLQVTDYINDCLADDIKLSDLAELVELSQFHFSRLFKQSTGVSPHQYVLQQRVERAKQLLKTTDLPVTDIACYLASVVIAIWGSGFGSIRG